MIDLNSNLKNFDAFLRLPTKKPINTCVDKKGGTLKNRLLQKHERYLSDEKSPPRYSFSLAELVRRVFRAASFQCVFTRKVFFVIITHV